MHVRHLARFAVVALALMAGCQGDGIAHAHPPPPSAQLMAELRDTGAYPRLTCRAEVGGDVTTNDRWLGEGVELHPVELEGDAWMEVVASAGGGVRTFPAEPPPFERSDRATVHIRAEDASPEAPVEVELSFYDAARANRYWRPLVFDDSEWHELDIELPYLRYDRGSVPRWENVTSWGLVFRTAGTVAIRGMDLWQDHAAVSPYLGENELRRFFSSPSRVRVAERAPFVVLTDEPRVDLDGVLEALVEMDERTRRRFPDMPTPERPVPLLIFADEGNYRSFWRRFARRTGSRTRPLSEDQGYTWMGIATAWYSDTYGPVRPTYVHEASHALLERSLGLAAQRSWLFEGLGVFDQLEVSRQDLRKVYLEGLRRSDVKMPLGELLAGGPIPTSHYWQATLFLEWVLVDPERTAALAAAVEDMRRLGSTDLRWLLQRHFELDLPTLTASFWAWADDTYGR